MESTVDTRPQRRGAAGGVRESQAICFPAPSQKQGSWPGLRKLLPLPWRRTVVIHGRRYWRPG